MGGVNTRTGYRRTGAELIRTLAPEAKVTEHAPLHTRCVFDPCEFPAVVDWLVSTARAGRYEALAACGHSGLIAAGAAAYILGVSVIAVRKEGDRAKGDGLRVNCVLPARPLRYAFVDDMVCSGGTMRGTIGAIAEALGDRLRCAAVLLYSQTPMMVGAELPEDAELVCRLKDPI